MTSHLRGNILVQDVLSLSETQVRTVGMVHRHKPRQISIFRKHGQENKKNIVKLSTSINHKEQMDIYLELLTFVSLAIFKNQDSFLTLKH